MNNQTNIEITAETATRGLTAAATMGRKRFRRASRNITCTRCGRHMRSYADSTQWLASSDGNGCISGWKCPQCLTPEERQRAERMDYGLATLSPRAGTVGRLQGIIRPENRPAPAGAEPLGYVDVPLIA